MSVPSSPEKPKVASSPMEELSPPSIIETNHDEEEEAGSPHHTHEDSFNGESEQGMRYHDMGTKSASALNRGRHPATPIIISKYPQAADDWSERHAEYKLPADHLIISELEENKKNASRSRPPPNRTRISSKTPDPMREAARGRRVPPTPNRPARTPAFSTAGGLDGGKKGAASTLYTGRLNPSFGVKEWDPAVVDNVVYEELSYLPAMPEGSDFIAADVASRMLKAKVDVLQDELQRMIHECLEKEDRIRILDTRLKELEHEKVKFQRDLNLKQQQLDKGQRQLEEIRSRADGLELQCVGLKKELEILKAGQKQVTVSKGSTESRLNKALEELERCKIELRQSKQASKEMSETEKKRLEDLTAENKNLEKQKTELLSAFKKQLKLIDVLKKQKMHLEVAKVLQFTEEEFMKALDWGS